MLYKIDKKGIVVNEASPKKVQPYYKNILREITEIYKENLGDNLLSIYVRGSVSVGRAKFYISDIDTVAVTNKKLPKERIIWIINKSKELEKKYPKTAIIELGVISKNELFKSRDYKNLRIYLKTQSFCLWGVDIVKELPGVKPGKKLAKILYGDIKEEVETLQKVFSGEMAHREYLFQKRPIKFWCVWMSRTILRAGLGLVMTEKPLYSQDLVTCYRVFSERYPEYKKEAKRLLDWNIKPSSNKKELSKFLNKFEPKFIKLWKIKY